MKRLLAATLAACLLTAPAFAAAPLAMLQQEQPTLAPMLKQVMPAVVNIVATGSVQAPMHPLLQDPFFRRFFEMPEEGPPMEDRASVGSGVIVDAAQGIVLTNHHVIENADKILVRLSDDREVEAKLVGADPDTDVAVLKIKASGLTSLPIGNSDKLEVGDFVVAIGNPFGLRQTVTSGIVSGLGRSGLGKQYEDFIQTDASINPGNSGGALINLNGELVGINTAILSRTGGNIGIGFAIPVNLARAVMSQIVDHGGVQRGRLGIIGQDLTPELSKAFGLERARGVVVAQVLAKSPAAQAGVESGDVITRINSVEIRDFAQLRNAIGLLKIGDTVKIELLREGKPRVVTAKVAAAPQEQISKADNGGAQSALAGARFTELNEEHPLAGKTKGVVVAGVDPGSSAMRAGLEAGDVVTSINRQPIEDLDDLKRFAGTKGQMLLHVRRGSGALFILLR
ncbi:MAG: DegQ family serine endoprotease [Nevskiales bacterium]